MKKLLVLTFALSLSITGCKKNNAAGTYKLNKEEMTKSMKAEIDKMPKEKQGFAKFGLAMIQAMDISLKLEAGGVVVAETTASFMGKKKQDTDKGTWKQDGNKIMITTTKERKRGDKVVKKVQTLTCTLNGTSLRCEDEAKKEDKAKKGRKGMVLVFDKA